MISRTALTLATLAVMSVALSPSCHAQGAAKPAAQAPAETQTQPAEPPAAPYEPQLLRLSEILGALAYLRELCGSPEDGGELRKHMAALLEAEAATPLRRARFAGAYNKGFRGFELTYRACTPNAELVVERYLAEGAQIVRDVASRFGGG